MLKQLNINNMDSETLEELAIDFYPDEKWELMERIAFKRGYTECKERSYSEKDILDLLVRMNDWPTTFNGIEDIAEWFEKFKL